ncbi:MAG TPA: hypothetical protein VII92_20310 [Anaerolineae bacterium]
MPGIATGEVFAFPEGKLYLYASASGTTSGSGVGFAENAALQFAYDWIDAAGADGRHDHVLMAKEARLTIGALVGDLTLWRLANATAAVNAKFEGLITGGYIQSAQFVLYSGAVDAAGINQAEGDLFRGRYEMHAYEWSAFGG